MIINANLFITYLDFIDTVSKKLVSFYLRENRANYNKSMLASETSEMRYFYTWEEETVVKVSASGFFFLRAMIDRGLAGKGFIRRRRNRGNIEVNEAEKCESRTMTGAMTTPVVGFPPPRRRLAMITREFLS